MRKSNMSDLPRAAAMSLRCRVRRLFSSAWIQARMVSSVMKVSQALAKIIGASAEILHDLLDASEGELVDLVIVVLGLEHGHDLLPVCVEDVAVVALAEALGDLNGGGSVHVYEMMSEGRHGRQKGTYIAPVTTEGLWRRRVAGSSNGRGCAVVAAV
jgi:hypothetical protein